MNAKELAKLLEVDSWYKLVTREEIATMLRQQQNEIEDLNKENTDLRYLIATKLEQQDGISLNSMAHPITNTPEPSYEIDLDKLETIEIDLPSLEPVAWMRKDGVIAFHKQKEVDSQGYKWQPLYTHPVKELTDEEIISIYQDLWKFLPSEEPDLAKDIKKFARAILRKAQDK